MLFWIPGIALIIVFGKFAAQYWVNRETTDSVAPVEREESPDRVPVNTPEGRAEMVRQQVISKIHWGASDREVFDWLQERHNIPWEKARELVEAGHQAQRKSVRVKAVITLVCAACGILLFGGAIAMEFRNHTFSPMETTFCAPLTLASIAVFFQSLWQLCTGQAESSTQ